MPENTGLTQNQNTAQPTVESTRGGLFYTPRVDIFENDRELTLFADIPGVRTEDLELRYERGQLFLHGRVRPREQQKSYLLYEYEDGDFHRVFDIHESIDSTRIEAECKNGVLTVHLPKVEAARPKQIKVRDA
jgi:HSP20 family protein